MDVSVDRVRRRPPCECYLKQQLQLKFGRGRSAMTMQSENKGSGLSNNLPAPPQSEVLRPADELVGLRRFLDRLDSAETTLFRNQVDVTESEISTLKHEI